MISLLLRTICLCLAIIFTGTLSAEDSVKLLTIGNSFAQNSTNLLPEMAAAGNKKLLLRGANLPGCSLEGHVRPMQAYETDPANPKGRPYTNPVTHKKNDWSLREALQSEDWDFVTIQQSSINSDKAETYEPFVTTLIEYIRKYAPHAEILIHQTWAYRQDYPPFVAGESSQEAMYQGLRKAYNELAARHKLRIIPVGDAFQLARAKPRWTFSFPDKNFDYANPPSGVLPDQAGSLNVGWKWSDEGGKKKLSLDFKHANREGEYLGAAAFYELLFNDSVEKNPFVPKGMDAKDAETLRALAHEAVAKRK